MYTTVVSFCGSFRCLFRLDFRKVMPIPAYSVFVSFMRTPVRERMRFLFTVFTTHIKTLVHLFIYLHMVQPVLWISFSCVCCYGMYIRRPKVKINLFLIFSRFFRFSISFRCIPQFCWLLQRFFVSCFYIYKINFFVCTIVWFYLICPIHLLSKVALNYFSYVVNHTWIPYFH